MNLPQDFIDRMKSLLQPNEFTAFIQTYEAEKTGGLRINPLKINRNEFKQLFSSSLQEVPFCENGFYFNSNIQPGKNPFHLAGLYYIQEPSAMFVAEVLAPKADEKVLDLCAAPGGKSTHLAGMMENTGLLIANEIHSKRVKALSENIERLGITNTLVTNETPERLAQRFPRFFDKILVDAPCSGEGMFRKDPKAIEFWSCEHVINCSKQQQHILDSAYTMLANGGTMVYSTCTFSAEENEQAIEHFLKKYPDMELLEIPKLFGIQNGVPEWSVSNNPQLAHTARLWPQHLKGEGHFVAKMRKVGTTEDTSVKYAKTNVTKQQLKDFHEFHNKYLNIKIDRTLYTFNTHLFSLPDLCPELTGLKVVRPGLHLGEFKKNRFEPNHAFALSLKKHEVKNSLSFSLNDDMWLLYVKGETIQTDHDRGWLLILIEGYPLGWGKESKGIIKNFYPKGLRIM